MNGKQAQIGLGNSTMRTALTGALYIGTLRRSMTAPSKRVKVFSKQEDSTATAGIQGEKVVVEAPHPA